MGRRKNKNKRSLFRSTSNNVNIKQGKKENTILCKPRYIIISRDHDSETMSDIPASLITNVIHNVAGKVNLIKKLNTGTVLIETKTETQAAKLMKLRYFPPKVPVRVTPHSWLNCTKGVIKCKDIYDLSIEYIKSELRSQSVVDVKPIMTREVGKDGECIRQKSSCYILTFSLPTLPEVVHIGGYLLFNPLPYMPKPKMCYRCFQYGHISNFCHSEKKLCRKCLQPDHQSENCTSSASCANCSEEFESGHAPCLGYMVHRKLMEIDGILKALTFEDNNK